MEKWLIAAKKADFDKWAKDFSVSPVLARIIRNRDITDEDEVRKFLYGTPEDCHSPFLLKDCDKAVDILLEEIKKGTRIRVIGDYDVDGICASFILTKGLKLLGADADTAIPHRVHDGYGLNENLIEEAHADGIGMIVTCDNGIAAAAQIETAAAYGIKVIVTDHHEVPFTLYTEADGTSRREEILPRAMAVVDPKQDACQYPYPGICGGMIAYKLMQGLLERSGSRVLEAGMDEFLEFAALSTVCDVMELKDENRIVVREGLKKMRHSANPGLRALAAANEIPLEQLSVYHLGFIIGPCLNATGRLDTAQSALALLQSVTDGEAKVQADALKALNENRKSMTLAGEQAAEQYIVDHQLQNDKVMLIFLPEVHESLAGIIAGRIRERYNHPVFVLTRGEEGLKGSGRSIEKYHMYDAMTEVKEYFTKFGGHAMAAGLSLPEENLEPLREAMNRNCTLAEEDFAPVIHIDIPMPPGYVTDRFVEELDLLEPYGVGNPKPLFAQKNLTFISGARMGSRRNVGRFRVVTEDGYRFQMVYFGDMDWFEEYLTDHFGAAALKDMYMGRGDVKLSAIYQVGWNTYNGQREIQFVMRNYKA